MKVTMRQIAKKVHRSTAAVSKALNDKPDIAAATRQRILRMARELGYSTDLTARALVTKRTMAIGVVVAFPQIPTVIERLNGIVAAASERGYQALVAFHDGQTAQELTQLSLLGGRTDGIILSATDPSPTHIAALRRLGVALVLMSEMLPRIRVDYVGVDDRLVGWMAAKHLHETGRARFVYFGDVENAPSDTAVLRGIQDYREKAGLVPLGVRAVWNNVAKAPTMANVETVMSGSHPPRAIFACSDVSALWIINRLRSLGVGVPDDVAVVASDDSAFSDLGPVPITCVAQPNFEIGRQAASLLIARISGEITRKQTQRIVFPPSLRIRDSSARDHRDP